MNPFADRAAHSVRVAFNNGMPHLINFSGRTYCVRRILSERSEKRRSWMGTYEHLYYVLETNSNTLELHGTGEQWQLAGVMAEFAHPEYVASQKMAA